LEISNLSLKALLANFRIVARFVAHASILTSHTVSACFASILGFGRL